MLPTAEHVREILDYDRDTGIFTWRKRVNHLRLVGSRAGSLSNTGYWVVAINNRKYLAHRLAWLVATGAWPNEHIDHIDGDRLNNRIANLREATRFENLQNTKGPNKNSKSGLLGVCRYQGKWAMQIMANRVRHRQTGFETAEEAHQEYLRLKRRLHSTCTI